MMISRKSDKRRPTAQRGSSLVVTMIMLVALMLMGVTAVVVSSSQYRMAGNLQFQNLAMNSAESALAQAENWTGANFNNGGFTTRVSGGLYPAGSNPNPYTMTWDDTTSVKVDLLGTQRYMVEMLGPDRVLPSNSVGTCNVYGASGPCPKVNVYRITARGTSIRGSVKLVQSIFAVRVNI
jgi:Tfp pilus assembly protein PilX